MFTGKSILHVNQNYGTQFQPGVLKGYFNNMTEKVLMDPKLLDSDDIPTVVDEKSNIIEFPVAIFQYGLGAYDLFLKTNDNKYFRKFMKCVQWALEKQEENGAWNNFFFYYPEHPYGAMCQGEGISLLARAYTVTKDDCYIKAAKKALAFMLKPVEHGGTTLYFDDKPCFLEYSHRSAVLNGWIFAFFGLYDYLLIDSNGEYDGLISKALSEIEEELPEFIGKFWSLYDLEGKIASPFYHNLHIAQMKALYEVTNNEIFYKTMNRWERQQNNFVCKSLALLFKVVQKVAEK